MNIKLIALDLDGTTFDNEDRLSEENRVAMQRAMDAGVMVVPASGRAYSEIPDSFLQWKEIKYYITANGAKILRPDKSVVYANGMSFAQAEPIIELMRKYDCLLEVYVDGVPYTQTSMMEHIKEHGIMDKYIDMFFGSRVCVEDVFAFFYTQKPDPEKINAFFGEESQRQEVLRALAQFSGEVEVTSSMDTNVEVNTLGSCKGDALAWLCNQLHIQPEEVLAMGDGNNDISMLKYAGTSLAVANAPDSVKAAAKYVTVSNEEHAVAQAIETFVLG